MRALKTGRQGVSLLFPTRLAHVLDRKNGGGNGPGSLPEYGGQRIHGPPVRVGILPKNSAQGQCPRWPSRESWKFAEGRRRCQRCRLTYHGLKDRWINDGGLSCLNWLRWWIFLRKGRRRAPSVRRQKGLIGYWLLLYTSRVGCLLDPYLADGVNRLGNKKGPTLPSPILSSLTEQDQQ